MSWTYQVMKREDWGRLFFIDIQEKEMPDSQKQLEEFK